MNTQHARTLLFPLLAALIVATAGPAAQARLDGWIPLRATVARQHTGLNALDEEYREEEVQFRSGEIVLSGTLMIPNTPNAHPALIFVQGSGPETRERRRPLAATFAQHGIAALIYDKRGTGSSTGDWYAASLDDLAGDALAAVRYLQDRVDVRAGQIGLWGLSQGGWVVPLAASRSSDVAFLITVSASGVSPARQELYRWSNLLPEIGYTGRTQDAAIKAVRLQFDLDRLDLPLVDTLFLGLDFEHDPVPVLEHVRQPVLAIWGAEDQVVPPYTSAAVFRQALDHGENEDLTIQVFAAAGHSMELPNEHGESVAYPPGYDEAMLNWVIDRTSGVTSPRSQEPDNLAHGPLEVVPPASLPWYGTASVQLVAISLLSLAFLAASLGWPLTYLIRRVSGRPRQARQDGHLARWIVSLASAIDLVLLIGFLLALVQFLMADEGALRRYLERPAVRIGSLLSVVSAAGWLGYVVSVWRDPHQGQWAHVHHLGIALAASAFASFLLYWNLPW